MAIRMPRIIQENQVLRRTLSNGTRTPTTTEVPKGYFKVYLGEKQEKKRFVIHVSLLSQPSFQDILRQAEEEFGYDHPMDGLTITCSEDMFVDLACRLGVFDLACRISTQSRVVKTSFFVKTDQ
ncbi:auxin-induced protein X15-like [Cynara cardunculus var. scolymus]|uniref:auxin-induced protein X15-like n=1 Tax=Cynara cardunculus var. scolymus TaxID=59895 RepID=UPI000D625007|nr:auxin-induced protein X15-like [Cynara cardunculus var. scolymus]